MILGRPRGRLTSGQNNRIVSNTLGVAQDFAFCMLEWITSIVKHMFDTFDGYIKSNIFQRTYVSNIGVNEYWS